MGGIMGCAINSRRQNIHLQRVHTHHDAVVAPVELRFPRHERRAMLRNNPPDLWEYPPVLSTVRPARGSRKQESDTYVPS